VERGGVKIFNLMPPLEDRHVDFVTRMNAGLILMLQVEMMIKKFHEGTGVKGATLEEISKSYWCMTIVISPRPRTEIFITYIS
jgi:hypothetical protein